MAWALGATLGLALGWSALQHLLPDEALRQHYRDVALPAVNPLTIGLLQLAGALALLFPATQPIGAGAVSVVMTLVLGEHLVRGRWDGGAWQAVAILAVALGSIVLRRMAPRSVT